MPRPLPKKKSSTKSPDASFRTPLRAHLKDLAAYPPGRPIEEVQREFGLKDVVKLASNENPLGPSPKAVKAMAKAAGEMNLYPDGAGFYLKQAIAKKIGVEPEEIILGNGSDEITLFLALCYLGPRRSIVTSDLAFVRYRMAAQLTGAKTRLAPTKRFAHDAQGIAAAVKKDTKLVFIDNPCNPTGTMMSKRTLSGLLRKIPSNVLVVIDEAYYEYAADDANYPDTLALRKKHPNLIVTRTFSKAYGLAGLRIGYGIARPEIIADLDRVRPPFNSNRMAQVAALAALGDGAHIRRSVRNNERGKVQLAKGFDRLGLTFVPTFGNFMLVEFGWSGPKGGEVCDALLRKGVIVRPMAGYGLASMARISIGTPEENRTLLRALAEVL